MTIRIRKQLLIAVMILLVLCHAACSNMLDEGKGNSSIADFEPPVITSFVLTGKDFTSIPIIPFDVEGTDDNGITSWFITESVNQPDADDPAWLDEKPASYTLQDVSGGNHTLYVWAKDGSGNVSEPFDCIIVNLAEPSADLANLELSLEGFDPLFSPGTVAYTMPVSLGTQYVTITPEALDPDGSITVNGEACASGDDFGPVILNLGENDINIMVRSSSGIEKTYRVEVVRGFRHAYIKESNTGENDQFGYSVALSGDTLVVGAWYEDSAAMGINSDQSDNNASDSGAVYVFTRSGTDWVQQAYIKASNTNENDWFGYSVAIYNNTLAVGAYREDSAAIGINGDQTNNDATYSGAVYVFTRSGSSWTQEAYIKASNTGAGDNFGISVALYENTLSVGAWNEDSAATGINGSQSSNTVTDSGAVYIFIRSGTTWSQQAYIKASNTRGYSRFGNAVALYGDTLAVGSFEEGNATTGINGSQSNYVNNFSGAVYTFTRSGTTWTQQAYIKASNTGNSDSFGNTVALYENTLAVGARYENSSATGINGDQSNNDSNNSGAVYVFTRSGTTWSQQAYIKATNTGLNDQFGYSVALYGDILAVGARGEGSGATGMNADQGNNDAVNSGAVYMFNRSGTTWSQQAYIKASNTGTGDAFGYSVALYGETLACGAITEDSAAMGINGDLNDNNSNDSGAVYVYYDLVDDLW